MKVFTEEEVAQYDGKNGNPAYVIYKGKVYNVSASFLWKDGAHQVLHSAGVDARAQDARSAPEMLRKIDCVLQVVF